MPTQLCSSMDLKPCINTSSAREVESIGPLPSIALYQETRIFGFTRLVVIAADACRFTTSTLDRRFGSVSNLMPDRLIAFAQRELSHFTQVRVLRSLDTQLAKDRHHGAPVRKRGLKQIEPHESGK